VRKRYLIGALAGVLVLAFAAVAIASPQLRQVADLNYSTGKAKRSTGVSATLQTIDPGVTPPGNQPGVDRVTINFRGARTDLRGVRKCTRPKSQADRCPRRTRVSTGGSSANTALANIVGRNPVTGQVTVTRDIRNNVTAYATNGGLYFVVKGQTLPTTVILKASLSRRGRLSVNVKRDVPTLPGGNKIVLTRFETKIKKSSRRVRGKRRTFIRSPRCGRSGEFRITTRFVYDDGTTKTPSSTQNCRR
jgi:hypothetical protein